MKRSKILVFCILMFGLTCSLKGLNISEDICLNNGIATGKVVTQKTTSFQTYLAHSPILITSNSQFVSQGFPGSGTSENPYRIEGFNISESEGELISISNTTVYFIINDNFINGLNAASSGVTI